MNRRILGRLSIVVVCTILISAIITIGANAAPVNTLMDDGGGGGGGSTLLNKLQYDAEHRAIAKAYYNALVWCYKRIGNNIDDFSIYFGLQGKFDAGKEGGTSLGYAIDDDYLNAIRGISDRFPDCSEGNLIAEAFNYFSSIAGSKSWDKWTVDDKKDLFCGSDGNGKGWFRAGYDKVGVNDYERSCRDDVQFVSEQSSNSSNVAKFAFVNTDPKNNGLDNLANFVNNKIFGGRFKINEPYKDDELYYVYRSLLVTYCADNQSGTMTNPNSSDYNSIMQFDTSHYSKDKTIDENLYYFEIAHKHANAQWYNFKIENDISQNTSDCNSGKTNLGENINNENDAPVKAAKESLAKFLDAGGTVVDPGGSASPSSPGSSPSDSAGDTDPCYNAGLDSMAWIMCPVINNSANAVDWIEGYLRKWLQIDADEVFKDETYTAWEVFRNIANVVLIVIFLVIIFSQLTGVGIDNYGIKKMLPKLIVMAVLINLSYLICEIAVDLSNILGVGLDNLFKSIGEGISGNSTTGTEIVAKLVAGLFAALSGVGAVAGTAITIATIGTGGGAMLVVSLILVLLLALVAVLMFFVMIGARVMIVIIFTVISPVAFALYILPNTQGLFKKWWKVFQTALVVFPICGALYGASYIIKAIVFGGSGEISFIQALVAVCAPYIPFLLLPSLLKGALAGLGAIGGAVTMLGNGLKRGIGKGNEALKNTNRYKDAQERNLERRIQRRAGIGKDGKPVEMGKFRKFISGGDRGIARARVQYVKNKEERAREADMMGEGFSALLAGSEAKIDAQRVADQESLMMNGEVPDVNVNDPESVSKYHSGLLEAYQNAKNDDEKAAVMTRIKAAQNILSKTDKGRGFVQTNFENAVAGGNTAALADASAHILSQYGDKYKSVNRGAHSMIMDLATAGEDTDGNLDVSSIKENIENGIYDMGGTSKYTAEALAGADEQAIQRLIESVRQGKLGGEGLANLQGTIREALEKKAQGTLNIKPEVEQQLKQMLVVEEASKFRRMGDGSIITAAGTTLTDENNELKIPKDKKIKDL